MIDGHVLQLGDVRDALGYNDGDDGDVGSDEEVEEPSHDGCPLNHLCMCLAQPSVVCITCVCVWHNRQSCVSLVYVFGITVSRVYYLCMCLA